MYGLMVGIIIPLSADSSCSVICPMTYIYCLVDSYIQAYIQPTSIIPRFSHHHESHSQLRIYPPTCLKDTILASQGSSFISTMDDNRFTSLRPFNWRFVRLPKHLRLHSRRFKSRDDRRAYCEKGSHVRHVRVVPY